LPSKTEIVKKTIGQFVVEVWKDHYDVWIKVSKGSDRLFSAKITDLKGSANSEKYVWNPDYPDIRFKNTTEKLFVRSMVKSVKASGGMNSETMEIVDGKDKHKKYDVWAEDSDLWVSMRYDGSTIKLFDGADNEFCSVSWPNWQILPIDCKNNPEFTIDFKSFKDYLDSANTRVVEVWLIYNPDLKTQQSGQKKADENKDCCDDCSCTLEDECNACIAKCEWQSGAGTGSCWVYEED